MQYGFCSMSTDGREPLVEIIFLEYPVADLVMLKFRVIIFCLT